ncbi:MAG TPA: Maf family protein [Planctomycetaceae bacterium]|nr:Maf family protein [Planctomycetaceae bacterium]
MTKPEGTPSPPPREPARAEPKIVLGSRSPRRLELMQLIVPGERIVVVPPRSNAEPGFDGLASRAAIEARLAEIARAKSEDMLDQIHGGTAGISLADVAAVVTADTVIIAADSESRPVVLGQPPDDAAWADTVRRWFHEFLLGRTHVAATAVCVRTAAGAIHERIVTTDVTFHAESPELVEWYLATGEPRGKAGGYALQATGSVFVSRVEGSLSNVVGLPIRELLDMLEAAGVRLPRHEAA